MDSAIEYFLQLDSEDCNKSSTAYKNRCNGESCTHGDQCHTGICINRKCSDNSEWWIYLVVGVGVVLLVLFLAFCVCPRIRKCREDKKQESEAMAEA